MILSIIKKGISKEIIRAISDYLKGHAKHLSELFLLKQQLVQVLKVQFKRRPTLFPFVNPPSLLKMMLMVIADPMRVQS